MNTEEIVKRKQGASEGGHRSKPSRANAAGRSSGAARLPKSKLLMRRVQESDSDPFGLARTFANSDGSDSRKNLCVCYWRGEWYRYRDGRYVTVAESQMKVDLTGFIKRHFDRAKSRDGYGNALKVTTSLVGNTLNALGAIVAVPDEVEMPAWLGPGQQRGPFLCVRNGLLDISGIPKRPIELREPSPLWFSNVGFPLDYAPDARCDGFLAFLARIMEGDEARIGLLQEFIGYLLTFDTSQHKFIVAEGEGANGKSVLLDVITALLGNENVAHVPLEIFGNRFQLTATLGKLANVCSEVGEIDKIAEGYLKQFTAGDRMYFDRKNISPVMAFPTARLILSTNNRPRFRDRSGGLWRRMIVLPFRVTIPPHEQDPLLKEKLKTELPGILAWALRGLVRLRERGHFDIPPVCLDALEDYRHESNPARVFLVESYSEKTGASVSCADLYDRYQRWCRKAGFEPLDSRQVGKEVRRAFPHVERVKSTGPGRPYVYRGLSYVSSGPVSSTSAELGVENESREQSMVHMAHTRPEVDRAIGERKESLGEPGDEEGGES